MLTAASTPRLLIFEGVIGSGKSTATRKFGELLAASGTPVASFTEATHPHPVRASDDLSDFFRPWEEIDADLLAVRVREKWTRYVQTRLGDQVFTVMDGQLFHGDLTNLFMMEAAPGDLAEHISALMHVLAPLEPVVIYFRPADLSKAIRKVFEARGDEWETYQLRWKLRSPYAAHRQLDGLQGLTAMYADYRALSDALFASLDCHKLAIDTSGGDWSQYYDQIGELLERLNLRL
jgi:hypothetical protein